MSPSALAQLLFSLEGRVSRRTYLTSGLVLMALKYTVEATAIYLVTGNLWTPLDYAVPVYTLHLDKLGSAPAWFLLAFWLWMLPFVWTGAALSLKRARDAGASPLVTLLFFAPFVNYVLMLVLAALRPREELPPAGPPQTAATSAVRAAMIAVPVAAAAGGVLAWLCATFLRSYGTTLFLGVPFGMGMLSGFLFCRSGPRTLGATLGVALLTGLVAGSLLLLVAIEGAVCLLMVAPVVLPLTLLGSLIGRLLAFEGQATSRAALALVFLPPLAWAEHRSLPPSRFEVASSIEVDAPPEVVWRNVIGFAEIPPPTHWLFSTGIAYPLRARIDGSGVGALRRCEFSTGAFVEPITTWDEPRRLAFDVVAQPDPMQEWSFYARLRPPHLEQGFRSRRGEFRLIALAGGRTRLEGSTWYDLDLAPVGYWRWMADGIVHRIHLRVLEHVKRLSEGG